MIAALPEEPSVPERAWKWMPAPRAIALRNALEPYPALFPVHQASAEQVSRACIEVHVVFFSIETIPNFWNNVGLGAFWTSIFRLLIGTAVLTRFGHLLSPYSGTSALR